MRQAILTKYLSPTNTRGARIKATASAGSITISYDDALSTEENHRHAARMLQQKFQWDNDLVAGWNEYTGVFVQVEKKKRGAK